MTAVYDPGHVGFYASLSFDPERCAARVSTALCVANRVGALLFSRGEPSYNFQGLRLYKEKFDPIWEPRYLASPGGLVLPRILTNVASLISGGLAGVVAK